LVFIVIHASGVEAAKALPPKSPTTDAALAARANLVKKELIVAIVMVISPVVAA
jgi:hypothetical protein